MGKVFSILVFLLKGVSMKKRVYLLQSNLHLALIVKKNQYFLWLLI